MNTAPRSAPTKTEVQACATRAWPMSGKRRNNRMNIPFFLLFSMRVRSSLSKMLIIHSLPIFVPTRASPGDGMLMLYAIRHQARPVSRNVEWPSLGAAEKGPLPDRVTGGGGQWGPSGDAISSGRSARGRGGAGAPGPGPALRGSSWPGSADRRSECPLARWQ